MNDIKRIGYACKYMHPEPVRPKKLLQEIEQPLNGRATTVTWLNRQSREVAEQRLWDIMEYNIQAYYNLVEYTGSLPHELRMVRVGSGVLPVYTEPIGVIIGAYLMYVGTARAISLRLASSLVYSTYGLVLTLVSLLCLPAIVTIL